MNDLKYLCRRSADEFPQPTPTMAALLAGVLLGGLAVFFGAVMFMGVTA